MKKLLILSSVAIATLVSMSISARADDVLDEYNAYIGEDDLYNSNGERLREPWQIIRQDRANFHKYRVRQPGDESDSYFSSVDNRAAAERMVRSGTITREARRLLLNGDVMINVRVMEGDDGVYLKINVE
ncbi:hypothetical protein M2360_002593 [Rhizobium sp. SG_E_25_P2]|jgi:hypothetical protein|uniref:hypothetical protein n=1 Tax=Rhizobium sp. SG_E_25_P2 TaxID=2879942 RepID=UPI002475CABE|nr:hypothetical protein [Rhizobium sp. SG_E_25_P2]MDH6267196.1 hypothetical protein [Rhizobium sp. SG_E_25_P2]